jgi:hypothetical protein
VSYDCPLWSSGEVVFECLNTICRTFGEGLDSSVRTVAHVANYLVPGRGALCEEAITHTLHIPSYQELSRHSVHDLLL